MDDVERTIFVRWRFPSLFCNISQLQFLLKIILKILIKKSLFITGIKILALNDLVQLHLLYYDR